MLPAIPVTDEQAKALAAGADLGKTVIQEGSKLAQAIGRIFGTVPQDVVGLVFGDHLRFIRTRNALEYEDRLNAILERRNVKETIGVSPSVATPLLTAAYDETRPELQKLWAELIAAAMDPARSDRVRLSFITTVKQFDPLDALLLAERYRNDGNLSPNPAQYMCSKLQRSRDQIEVSAENLERLNCFVFLNDKSNFLIKTYGRELMRACLD